MRFALFVFFFVVGGKVMPMILIADDSEVDRLVITEMLKKEPLDWLVEVVSSAEEAIALMKEMAFDVIITDVLMSGLSGLDLLNHVHRQPHRVPVIVISGQDDQQAAVDALRQGAASFVSKSELASRLSETVKQVLDSAKSEKSYQNLVQCAEELRFQFKLENDPGLIGALVSLVQQMAQGMGILTAEGQTRLGIAIDEAVINAMCHGNLELSEEQLKEVRSHHHDDGSMEVIALRRQEEPYCNRFVHLLVGISREGIKIIVRDDGKGFPVKSLEQSEGHRGITLIRNLVDKATFNETGNELTLVKFKEKVPQRQASGDPNMQTA